jgi:shikimate dehydrogenase
MAPRRAAVLGSPISHSRSPLLHRAAYAALGLDWVYDAIDVTTEALPGFLDACVWPEWAGLSLTMPLKTDVLPFLDEVSELAAVVRAANTVVFSENGRSGHNTDVAGMQRALSEAQGSDVALRRGIIIGSGATARSAMAALAGLGADDIAVIARNPDRAAELAPLGADLGVAVTLWPWDDVRPLDADAVIATVPPGAADMFVSHVPEAPGVLLDVAYGSGMTPLTSAWSRAGGASSDGLDLLLWQAVDQVRLMTGAEPPVAAMRAALQAETRTPGP